MRPDSRQPNTSSGVSCPKRTLTPSEAGGCQEGLPGWPALRGGREGRSWARQLRTCFQLQTGADRAGR